jgi:hypothetical protein
MSAEQENAVAFVSRLLANPALKPWTPLQREEQIIQFLQANANQLVPTLSSPQYFAGKSWNQIVALLVIALMEEVDKALMPDLERIIDSTIDFTYVNHLTQQGVMVDKVRLQVRKFVDGLMKKPETRRAFTGPHAAIAHGALDKYLDEIWNRKGYIHFEVTKVQRLRLSRAEVRSMIETTLLLKPSLQLVASGHGAGATDQATGVQAQFAEKVFQVTKKQIPLLPDAVIKSGINSNVSFVENRFIEATARLAAIFAARFRNYQPNVRVDRGADSPDKSWISIARRNYKFYGFDIKMLDELYSIAAENGW